MHYMWWAIISMGGYGVTSVLLKSAFKQIPPEVSLVITNTILILSGLALVLYRGQSIAASLSLGRPTVIVVLAGISLSISIIAYYIALSRGPATIVVPIFAMSMAVAGILAFMFLGETITTLRVAGMVLAGISIFLLTR